MNADEAQPPPSALLFVTILPFMQRLVTTSLKSQDIVAVVDSAQAAIDALSTLCPMFLTLDLELGSEDGISVLRAVRELPVQVVVISAFTAHVGSERSRNALANGAVQCIGKPGLGEDVEEFADRVVRVVEEALLNTVQAEPEVAALWALISSTSLCSAPQPVVPMFSAIS